MKNIIKNLTFALILINSLSDINAQEEVFYWYGDQKIFLTKFPEKKFILTTISDSTLLRESLNIPGLNILNFSEIIIPENNLLDNESAFNNQYWAIIEGDSLVNYNMRDYQFMNYASDFLLTDEKDTLGQINQCIVSLFNSSDSTMLFDFRNDLSFQVLNSTDENKKDYTIIIDKNSPLDVFKLADTLHKMDFIRYVEPAFIDILQFACVNDTLFGDQWALDNTGQIDTNFTGFDINF